MTKYGVDVVVCRHVIVVLDCDVPRPNETGIIITAASAAALDVSRSE